MHCKWQGTGCNAYVVTSVQNKYTGTVPLQYHHHGTAENQGFFQDRVPLNGLVRVTAHQELKSHAIIMCWIWDETIPMHRFSETAGLSCRQDARRGEHCCRRIHVHLGRVRIHARAFAPVAEQLATTLLCLTANARSFSSHPRR